MAIQWNPRLPIPLRAGASNKESNRVKRNDVETGPARFELISEHGFAMFNVMWSFSELENQLFEGWYKHEVVFGSKSFDMELNVGAGIKFHECFFMTPPKSSFKDKRSTVKATLLIIEKQYDSLSEYNALKAANP